MVSFLSRWEQATIHRSVASHFSHPSSSFFSAKRKNHTIRRGFFWRRRRDLNPRYPFGVYTISNRARSASYATSPNRCFLVSQDIVQYFLWFVKPLFYTFLPFFICSTPFSRFLISYVICLQESTALMGSADAVAMAADVATAGSVTDQSRSNGKSGDRYVTAFCYAVSSLGCSGTSS